MTVKKIFGIDLGTTYSGVSHLDQYGQAVMIDSRSDDGQPLVPSVVYVPEPDDDGKVIEAVGISAKGMAQFEPERVMQVMKRNMPDGLWETRTIDGAEYTPVDFSALILKHVAAQASARIGEPVTDVVITVPAYFGSNEKTRTKKAGQQAGLNVHDVLPEPMAAALHYRVHEDEENTQTILVYDLGGGTFDVTVMRLEGRDRETLAVKGDHNLGGYRWDEALAREWAESISMTAEVDFEEVWNDPECNAQLRLEAEATKRRLSDIKNQIASVSFRGNPYQLTIDRDRFDELTSGLLENTIALVDQSIEVAERNHPGTVIDKVLLVGSSTLMPQVRARLTNRFGPEMEILQDNPHFAVAMGAAIYAQELQVKEWIREYVNMEARFSDISSRLTDGEVFDDLSDDEKEDVLQAASGELGMAPETIKDIVSRRIIHITPKSFGIVHYLRNSDELGVTNMIRAQDAVPAKHTGDFGTRTDDQRRVRIACVENERDLGPDDPPVPHDPDEVIGEAWLDMQPGLPAGSPITVTVELTDTGLVRVHGRDDVGGKEVTGQFVSKIAPLSDEDIARKREELDQKYAQQGHAED